MGQRTTRRTKLLKKIDEHIAIAEKILIADYKEGFIMGLKEIKKIIKSS